MEIIGLLVTYRKQIAYGFVALVVGILIYDYGFRIPAKLANLEVVNQELTKQVKAGEEAIVLLEEIQKGKVDIDAITQKRISSIKAGSGKRIVITGGMPLPSMPKANAAH